MEDQTPAGRMLRRFRIPIPPVHDQSTEILKAEGLTAAVAPERVRQAIPGTRSHLSYITMIHFREMEALENLLIWTIR